MKQFLTLVLTCLPFLCFGAPTYTTYFNNTHTYTNATIAGTNFAGRGVFTNGITAGASTFTGAVGFADGSSTAPSIAWTSDADGTGTGFYRSAANTIAATINGSDRFRWDGSGFWVNDNSFTVAFGSGRDVFLVRGGAAATLQLGQNAASPTAQRFKGPDGSGSNVSGGGLTIDGGNSTGTGTAGNLILRTANTSGTPGSSANTFSERFHAVPKFVNLVSATATTLFTIPVPATNYVGVTATITVYATDGTDHQSKTSVITCDAINKAGTITETLSQVDNTTATSSGTLTATYDSVDAGSNVLGIRVSADSSLSETVLRAKIVITAINSNGSGAVTEQ